jgi:hypothetical protein
MELIKYVVAHEHVSQDTVVEFESTIMLDDGVTIYPINRWKRKLSKSVIKLCFKYPGLVRRNSLKMRSRSTFSIVMGSDFKKSSIPFLFNDNNSAYFFDAWPYNHEKIVQFIKVFDLKNAFFSSKQVVDIFKAKGLACNFYWVPEGITIENYRYKPPSEKDIDVLAFGRKYDDLHHRIVDGLSRKKLNYLYETEKGHIIFPKREDFIDGLARTKISICIPSNITHPERSGGISTMTVRYLQSMAAKCLILGYLPKEMEELFDYNPIIELDMNDPLHQILEILKNYSHYQPLIDRNYDYVRNNHTWHHRYQVIKPNL